MSSPAPATLLVIGVGNPARGDDAVGWRVVDALAGDPALRTLRSDGDVAELVDAWSGEARAVVVDACDAGGEPGALVTFDAARAPLPARAFPSSHAWGLAQAIELARALGTLPDSLPVIAVELGRLDAGAPLSPAVAAAVPRACEAVRALAAAAAAGTTRPSNPEVPTMHEHSLIADILRRIEAIARAHGASRVARVEVRIGAWAHISAEHFREHFVEGTLGTVAEGAQLDAYVDPDTSDPRAQEIVLVAVDIDDGDGDNAPGNE